MEGPSTVAANISTEEVTVDENELVKELEKLLDVSSEVEGKADDESPGPEQDSGSDNVTPVNETATDVPDEEKVAEWQIDEGPLGEQPSEMDIIFEKSNQLDVNKEEEQSPEQDNGGNNVTPVNENSSVVAEAAEGNVDERKIDEGQLGEQPSEMDAIFKKSKELALTKEFHGALMNDSVFGPLLVLALTSDSEYDVMRALEIFNLLALNRENSPGLTKVLHLFDALKAAFGNKKLSKEVRDFAQVVLETVRKVPLKAQPRTKQNEGRGPAQSMSTKKPEMGGGQGKRNQSGTKGKGITLYVPLCIFKEKRLKMTEALLTLNGILSITYDLKRSQCLIRAKSHIPNELFGKSIANLGFECHLVTRVDNEEILTKMEPDPKLDNSTSVYDKENWAAQGRRSPQYLSDSDSEVSFQDSQAQAVALGTEAGGGAGKGKKGGWFSSAANFLQKSLYW